MGSAATGSATALAMRVSESPLSKRYRSLRLPDLPFGAAVLAVAGGGELADAADCTEGAARAAELAAEAAFGIASSGHADLERRRRLRFFGEDVDHAARRVSVQRREGSAQDLDAIGREQVDVGDLALAVRQRRRNAVDIDADPADAERRPRAEAANRDLQVLRIVLPVARQQARHGAQAFGDVHLRAVVANGVGVDAIDRRRHVERRGFGARRRDDHRRQRGGRLCPRRVTGRKRDRQSHEQPRLHRA